MKDLELKPCPFCGGAAKYGTITRSGGMDGSYTNWQVYCTSCYVTMEFPADNFYGRNFMTKEEIIDKWNTRVVIDDRS